VSHGLFPPTNTGHTLNVSVCRQRSTLHVGLEVRQPFSKWKPSSASTSRTATSTISTLTRLWRVTVTSHFRHIGNIGGGFAFALKFLFLLPIQVISCPPLSTGGGVVRKLGDAAGVVPSPSLCRQSPSANQSPWAQGSLVQDSLSPLLQ